MECFTSLAMQRPLDNDVQMICQNQDSNHMLSSLTDVLPTQLAGAMETSVSRAMQPVAKAMDNFLVGATRAQVDGVGRIVGAFVQQMNASLNDQFIQLGRTMTEINQNQQMSMEQVRQSMAAANTIVADVQQLHAVSNDVMAHFEQYVRELGDARRRDEHFEQSAAALLEKMQQMNAAQAKVLQQVSEGHHSLLGAMTAFTAESEKSMTRLQQNTTVTSQHLEQVASTMNGAGQELSTSCQTFVQNVVGGLSQALGMFDQNMTTLVAALTEQINRLNADGASAETTAATAELQKLLTELKQVIPVKEV